MDEIKTLHELCDTITREIEDANEKIRMAGGKLSAGDIDYLDKLTHSLKSIKTTIAMMEADDDEGYSGRYMPYYGGMMRGSYASTNRNGNDGRGGSSYARGGRGRTNARRDSMGRYSGNDGGYSYDAGMEDVISDLRGMMGDMPEEKRRKVERLVSELER